MQPTNAVAASGPEDRKPQKSLFDLDQMATVTLVKPYIFHPVTDAKMALERVQNDSAKFLDILNRGLRNFQDEQVKADANIAWKQEDEEGNLTDFSGTPADDKAVNALVLNMAKASFGYLKAADAEGRKAAKEAALAFIKSQPVLIEGMKAQLESA
jgi:hypothetical protein